MIPRATVWIIKVYDVYYTHWYNDILWEPYKIIEQYVCTVNYVILYNKSKH